MSDSCTDDEPIIRHGRRVGNTTRQMLQAPHRALFVWCTWAINYPKDLARDCGREDLQIVSPAQLWKIARSSDFYSGVVLDHAAELTADEQRAFEDIRVFHVRPRR